MSASGLPLVLIPKLNPASETYPYEAFWAGFSAIAGGVGALAAIGALLIAAIQLGHLIESNKQLARSNLELSRPRLSVDLAIRRAEFREQNGNLQGSVVIVVRNDGAGTARNVSFQTSPPFDATESAYVSPEARASALDRLHQFFGGVVAYTTLSPGKEFTYVLDHAPGAINDTTLPRRYEVTAEYSTIDEEHDFCESFTLDLDLLGPAIIDSIPWRRISKDIEAVAANLKSRTHGIPKLVEAIESLIPEKERGTKSWVRSSGLSRARSAFSRYRRS